MQDRFVGDIGDFFKFGLLRAISPGYRVGVAWWLMPGEANSDGNHVAYFDQAHKWRHLDPHLFDSLKKIVNENRRQVASLEQAGLLPNARFAGQMLPVDLPHLQRQIARHRWFEGVLATLRDTQLIFADPDNGLEPATFSPSSPVAGKSISMDEIQVLARGGRCVVVYHHQTRRKGGHQLEIQHWLERFRDAGHADPVAVRAASYSPRAFFIVNPDRNIRLRAQEFCRRWGDVVSWHALA